MGRLSTPINQHAHAARRLSSPSPPLWLSLVPSPLPHQRATPLPQLTRMNPQSTPSPTEFKTITLRPTLGRVKTATVTLLPAPTLSIFPTVVFRRFPGP